MKKTPLILSLAFSILVFAAADVRAQQTVYTKPDDAIRTMPVEGPGVEDFVPKGWEVVSRADGGGDLNGDNLGDVGLAIGLNEDMREMLDDGESPPYIVVVLFAKKEGGYRRFAVNGKLYPKFGGDAPIDLKIEKRGGGVLTTNQNFRDGWAVDVTYRFRYHRAADRLMLIGFDLERYNRADIYAGNKVSENYLTGTKIEYAKSSRSRKTSVYSETSRRRIPRSRTSFEDTTFFEHVDVD